MNTRPKADGKLTVKQQRAAQRDAKLATLRAQQARAVRRRRIGIIAAIIGSVAVLALLVASVVLTPTPAQYEAGSEGASLAGVEEFSNTATHVETPVAYPQTPPAGGDHSAVWLNCGIYTEQVPNENAVHSLEHGAVWLTYDPATLSDDDVATLRDLMPASHAILSPFPGMDTPVAVSAWNAQLTLDDVDAERIGGFFEEYWKSEKVPEPGALCSGAFDGPGLVS